MLGSLSRALYVNHFRRVTPNTYFPFNLLSFLNVSFKIIISVLAFRFDREDTFSTIGLSSSLAVLGISRLSDPLTRRPI
jgi:hypothetical protein